MPTEVNTVGSTSSVCIHRSDTWEVLCWYLRRGASPGAAAAESVSAFSVPLELTVLTPCPTLGLLKDRAMVSQLAAEMGQV